VLAEKVLEAYRPVYPTTKAQVIEGYQKKYEGKLGRGGWKQALTHDLSPIAGIKPKNLEKRFDAGPKGRINNPEPKNKAQYVELGRKLPPIGFIPPSSFTVTFMLDIKISNNCGHIRGPYTVHIGGKDAEEFAKHPTFEMVMAYYFADGGPPDYENPVENICAVIQLTVS